MDFDAAIPGNGDVLTKADVQGVQDEFVYRGREEPGNWCAQGVPQDQLLAQIKTDDIGWGSPSSQGGRAFNAELSASK